MITGFGVKNFKRFQDTGLLPLSGTTILVGPNSSGKSSLIKALILLKDNISNRAQSFFIDKDKLFFDFHAISSDDVNLGTFSRVINDKAETDTITLYTQVKYKNDSRTIELDVVRDQIDETLGSISRVRITEFIDQVNTIYDFDMATKEVCVTMHISNFEQAIQTIKGIKNENEIWRDIANDMLPSDVRHYAEEQRGNLDRLINDGDGIERIHQELDESLNGTVTNDNETYEVKNGYVTLATPFTLRYSGDLIGSLLTGIDSTAYHGRHSPFDKKSMVNTENIIITNSRSANRSFHNKVLDYSIPHIEYIYAHNISKRVFFSMNDRNDYISRTLHEVYQTRALSRTEAHDFLKYWIEKFGIGTDVQINRIEGEGYSVRIIKQDGTSKNLVDIGTGSAQIVLLLLKISVILATQQSGSVMVIIEEPEQNMHPNYQSLLADLFFAIHQYGIKMIVETHSEYMIRRSQVIVAQIAAQKGYRQDELDQNNPFKVLYFPENGKPYDMHYNVNGDFEHLFGEGFFDAAALNRIELYRMQLANNK